MSKQDWKLLQAYLASGVKPQDVVKAVRCKNCCYYDHGLCICPSVGQMLEVPENHFRSYGEDFK